MEWPEEEGSDSYEDPNRGRVHTLQAAHIDGLRVVAEPVAKVASLDKHRGPFLAVQERNGLEDVLNVWTVPESARHIGALTKGADSP